MPYNTYRNIKESKKNTKKVIRDVKCDAVKIENKWKELKRNAKKEIEKLIKSKLKKGYKKK